MATSGICQALAQCPGNPLTTLYHEDMLLHPFTNGTAKDHSENGKLA